MKKELEINALWDSEAQVWVAESNDVPGLITEAETMEQLINKLKILIPELLEANGIFNAEGDTEILFHLFSERIDNISLHN